MEKLMDGWMDGWVDFRIAKHKICSGGEGRGGRGSTPHGKPSGEQTLSRGHTAVVFSLL